MKSSNPDSDVTFWLPAFPRARGGGGKKGGWGLTRGTWLFHPRGPARRPVRTRMTGSGRGGLRSTHNLFAASPCFTEHLPGPKGTSRPSRTGTGLNSGAEPMGSTLLGGIVVRISSRVRSSATLPYWNPLAGHHGLGCAPDRPQNGG